MSTMSPDKPKQRQKSVNATDRKIIGLNPADPALVKRLVTCLLYAFDLQSEANLSFLLGYAEYESNEDALTAWIGDRLQNTAWVEPNDLFNNLANQLHTTLKFWRAQA